MPRLLYLIACEKLIINDRGVSSLIDVIERVDVELVPDAPIPAEAVAPREWDIVALYQPDPGEWGATFIQKLVVEPPQGKTLPREISHEAKFTFPKETDGKSGHRQYIHLNAFPIGLEGNYVIKVWVYPEGKQPTAQPIGTYSIEVRHKKP